MTDARPASSIYPDWPRYAARLPEVIGGLDQEALALRSGPDALPIWGIAAHLAGSRVYWLCGIFGEPGDERTPFAGLPELGWEDEPDHPRSAEELVTALETTWTVIVDVLERWTLDTLDVTAERHFRGRVQHHSRASVLNRLFAHDAFHAGEISLLLGARGLPSLDFWERPFPPI